MDDSNNSAALRGDPDLLAARAAHQPEALQELYARYSSVAYSLAMRMLGDVARAEECVQAVFLRLWHHPPPAEYLGTAFSAWLLAAVHQTARAWQRSAAQDGVHLPVEEIGTDLRSERPPALDPGSAARHLTVQQEQAISAVAGLHPAERTVLERAYFDGQTTAEIAASLQEPLVTVQMRMRDGVQRLSAAFAGATQPHGADTGTNQLRGHAGPSAPAEALPSAHALADETNTEYRAIVRHPPVEQDAGGVGSSMGESSAVHQLNERQDQLLLTLAHELKTPITTIKGSVQLAHRRLRAAGLQQEAAYLEVANAQLDRLTALVDYLLRAGQLNSNEVELRLAHFNLTALVREVGMAMEGFSKRHTMIVQAPEDITVEGDPDRLEQVLRNLITNAIKYSPSGGRVEITLDRVGEAAELCVRDYGIGIPMDERDQVFERFHRASNVGHVPGFGLGLSMSRDIVRAHHGRLWVGDLPATGAANPRAPATGQPGEAGGSLLCLTLPLKQAAEP